MLLSSFRNPHYKRICGHRKQVLKQVLKQDLKQANKQGRKNLFVRLFVFTNQNLVSIHAKRDKTLKS